MFRYSLDKFFNVFSELFSPIFFFAVLFFWAFFYYQVRISIKRPVCAYLWIWFFCSNHKSPPSSYSYGMLSSSIYHSTAQRNQPCTKQRSTYTPIKVRQRKQADRVGESQHVVEHLFCNTLCSQNRWRIETCPAKKTYTTTRSCSCWCAKDWLLFISNLNTIQLKQKRYRLVQSEYSNCVRHECRMQQILERHIFGIILTAMNSGRGWRGHFFVQDLGLALLIVAKTCVPTDHSPSKRSIMVRRSRRKKPCFSFFTSGSRYSKAPYKMFRGNIRRSDYVGPVLSHSYCPKVDPIVKLSNSRQLRKFQISHVFRTSPKYPRRF